MLKYRCPDEFRPGSPCSKPSSLTKVRSFRICRETNMRYLVELGLVAGVVLGASGTLRAQYEVTRGGTAGAPIRHRYVYPNHSFHGYGTAHRGPVAAPVIRPRPVNPYGYVNRPYYGAYGYGNYSNGSTDGFPPFRTLRAR
jgi:hypothetical protein